ncbi:hypothetical protein GWK47_021308 [Chionoecetes opilio]|uniref:Uncharacterized protein n=1 Tax=Chionoecetes opilio TaxID=41210 RepID=A0A8J4XPN1_CHIOP|nr:hypothetical protein GWK47_021308 [Chionoecetes opilio]
MNFEQHVIKQLRRTFQVGSFDSECFKYVGLNVVTTEDGGITIDQFQYGASLNPVALSKRRALEKTTVVQSGGFNTAPPQPPFPPPPGAAPGIPSTLDFNQPPPGFPPAGLYDYYKEKSQSVKRIEKDVSDGLREATRSPSPVVIEPPPDDDDGMSDQPLRRYRSVSPEKEEEKVMLHARSRSASRSPARRNSVKQRSRSPTPPQKIRRLDMPLLIKSILNTTATTPNPPSFTLKVTPKVTLQLQVSKEGQQVKVKVSFCVSQDISNPCSL